MEYSDKFDDLLYDDEEVLWTGRPGFTLALTPTTRSNLFMLFYFVTLIVWIVWYLAPEPIFAPDNSVEVRAVESERSIENPVWQPRAASSAPASTAQIQRGSRNSNQMFWIIGAFWGFILLRWIYGTLSGFIWSVTRHRATYYCLTDERAIIIEDRKRKYWAAVSVAYDTPIALLETRGGKGHISFGRRYDFDTEDWPMFRGFSFFNIKEPDAVIALVEQVRNSYIDDLAANIRQDIAQNEVAINHGPSLNTVDIASHLRDRKPKMHPLIT